MRNTILVTIRRKDIVPTMIKPDEILLIHPMDETSAHQLLRKRLVMEVRAGHEDLNDLAKALDYMPLNLV